MAGYLAEIVHLNPDPAIRGMKLKFPGKGDEQRAGYRIRIVNEVMPRANP